MTPDTSMIRVLIVDDHPPILDGLKLAFDRGGEDVLVVGLAESFAAAVTALEALRPDVLVTDLRLTRGSEQEGIRLVEHARKLYPDLGIVVHTMYGEDRHVLAALKAKASVFVLKGVQSVQVVDAARRAARKPHDFTAPELAAVLQRQAAAPVAPQLSTREQEVLELVADGIGVAAIGRRLFISESTTKTHVGNIYKKLGATNRTQAVMTAIRLGLLPSPEGE